MGRGVVRVGVLGVGGMSGSEPAERVLRLVPLARVVTGWGVGGSVAAGVGGATNVVGVGVLGGVWSTLGKRGHSSWGKAAPSMDAGRRGDGGVG